MRVAVWVSGCLGVWVSGSIAVGARVVHCCFAPACVACCALTARSLGAAARCCLSSQVVCCVGVCAGWVGV